MVTDKLLELSEDQEIKSLTSHASENTLDFGHEGDEVAKTLNLVVQVKTAFASEGAATLGVKVQTKNRSENSWTDLMELPAVAKSELTAGARPWGFVKVPYGVKEQLRLVYNVGTAAFTAGKVWATLTPSLEIK